MKNFDDNVVTFCSWHPCSIKFQKEKAKRLTVKVLRGIQLSVEDAWKRKTSTLGKWRLNKYGGWMNMVEWSILALYTFLIGKLGEKRATYITGQYWHKSQVFKLDILTFWLKTVNTEKWWYILRKVVPGALGQNLLVLLEYNSTLCGVLWGALDQQMVQFYCVSVEFSFLALSCIQISIQNSPWAPAYDHSV